MNMAFVTVGYNGNVINMQNFDELIADYSETVPSASSFATLIGSLLCCNTNDVLKVVFLAFLIDLNKLKQPSII